MGTRFLPTGIFILLLTKLEFTDSQPNKWMLKQNKVKLQNKVPQGRYPSSRIPPPKVQYPAHHLQNPSITTQRQLQNLQRKLPGALGAGAGGYKNSLRSELSLAGYQPAGVTNRFGFNIGRTPTGRRDGMSGARPLRQRSGSFTIHNPADLPRPIIDPIPVAAPIITSPGLYNQVSIRKPKTPVPRQKVASPMRAAAAPKIPVRAQSRIRPPRADTPKVLTKKEKALLASSAGPAYSDRWSTKPIRSTPTAAVSDSRPSRSRGRENSQKATVSRGGTPSIPVRPQRRLTSQSGSRGRSESIGGNSYNGEGRSSSKFGRDDYESYPIASGGGVKFNIFGREMVSAS